MTLISTREEAEVTTEEVTTGEEVEEVMTMVVITDVTKAEVVLEAGHLKEEAGGQGLEAAGHQEGIQTAREESLMDTGVAVTEGGRTALNLLKSS